MRHWLVAALLLLSAPVFAQSDSGGATPPPADKPADKPASGEKSESEKEDEGPLTFSPNRTGWGFLVYGGIGYDTNIFKEDRDEQESFFLDGRAAAYFGVNIAKVFALGVEGRARGRIHFSDQDANTFELFLAAFLEKPAEESGAFGAGLRVEGLYDQQQYYEIFGPITRQDDLRRGEYRARSWFAWMPTGFLRFEWGLALRLTDFTEDKNALGSSIASKDSWEFTGDFMAELRFWKFFNIAPYIRFDYEWFREQFDLHPDDFSVDGDKLQLLRFEVGAKAKLRLWSFNNTSARVYARRQDDSAQGFDRYWQYGLQAQTMFNVSIVRFGGGFDVWTREFDERIDPDFSSASRESVFERYLAIHAEIAVTFVWMLEVGIRYEFQRRTSDLNNEGYLDHQFLIFIGFDW